MTAINHVVKSFGSPVLANARSRMTDIKDALDGDYMLLRIDNER